MFCLLIRLHSRRRIPVSRMTIFTSTSIICKVSRYLLFALREIFSTPGSSKTESEALAVVRAIVSTVTASLKANIFRNIDENGQADLSKHLQLNGAKRQCLTERR